MIALCGASEPRCDHPERSEGSRELLGLKGRCGAPLIHDIEKVSGKEPGEITQLQFEVNGKQYFLAFVEDERRWYVFSPTPQGMHRIPVYIDAPVAGGELRGGKVRDTWN